MIKIEINDPHFLPQRGCQLILEFIPGKPLVLAGENGLGKTTLLHRVRSLQKNSSLLNQKPIDLFYERKLEKIKHIMESHKDKMNLLRWERLWDAFGLGAKEDFLTSHLSGGEAQCVKICMALAKEVDCYLLDEPSQSLDVEKKKILGDQLKLLADKEKIILLVEHDTSWIPKEWEIKYLKEIDGAIRFIK